MDNKRSFGSWFMDLGFGLTTVGLAIFVLVVIAVIAVNYMTIKQQQVKQFDQTHPSTNSVQTQENATFSEDCDSIDKAGNPLIGEFMRMNNRAVGNLIGNIDTVSFTDASTSATIDISSKDGYQHHTFTVHDHPGLVAQDGTQKQLSLKDLKYSDEVAISFECDSKTSNKFVITQIALVLRRS